MSEIETPKPNNERVKKYKREYYEKNKAKKAEYYSEYYKKHREEIRKKQAEKYAENKGPPKKMGRPRKHPPANEPISPNNDFGDPSTSKNDN